MSGCTWEDNLRNKPEETGRILRDRVPMKPFGQPHEVADAVVFLCSSRESFITGSVLRVDGGQSVSLL